MTKYKKKVIAHYEKTLGRADFEVYVLDDVDYFNIHIISEKYRKDEMNTLKLQEPKEVVSNPTEYFDIKYMISRLMEHVLWDEFYDEGIISAEVIIHELAEH